MADLDLVIEVGEEGGGEFVLLALPAFLPHLYR